jgi:hypothetical protein
VPLAGAVRRELAALKLRTGRDGDDFVFGRTASLPFVRSTIRSRALAAWEAANERTTAAAAARRRRSTRRRS